MARHILGAAPDTNTILTVDDDGSLFVEVAGTPETEVGRIADGTAPGQVPTWDGTAHVNRLPPIVPFYPANNGSDDAARLQTLLNALVVAAVTGVAVQLMPCTTAGVAASLDWQTPVVVPSNTTILGTPATVVESTIAPTGGGGQTEFAFGAYPVAPAGSADTTTNGAIAVGATSFVLVSTAIGAAGADVAVGDTVVVGEGNRFFYYLVRGVVLGTKTVTVDRPFVTAYASGVGCGVRTVPTNIKILGNGMPIRGTGDRAIGISGGYRCHVNGVTIEPNDAGAFFGDTPLAFDIGCRFSVMSDCHVDNGGLGLGSFSSESNESCNFVNIEARNGPTNYAGCLVGVSYYCNFTRIRVVNCWAGIWLNSGGGADIYGVRGCSFTDCELRECTGPGIYILNGSSFNSFVGCRSTDNGTFGVYIGAGTDDTEPTRQNSFVNLVCDRNTSGGFQTATGTGTKASRDTLVTNLQVVDGGGYALDCGGSVTINGLIARGNPSGGIQVASAASLVATNVTLEKTTAVFWAGVIMNTTGSISIAGLRIAGIAGAGTSVIYSHTAGYLVDEDVRILSGTPTIGYSSAASANAKYRRGPHSDLSQATTPYSFGAGSLQNWGTLTLNGATPVAVNAVCTAQDVPLATLKTVGGTQGPVPTFVCGAGTVTGTGTALDTGIWQWWIP